MAISRSFFNNVLREVVSAEFSDIPTDESSINYTFSERFTKKMEKLIRSQKRAYYKLINTVSKRAAIICLLVITLFMGACSIKVIREPIVNLFTEVYESFTKIFFFGKTTEVVAKEFKIMYLPEGFKQTEFLSNDIRITQTFESSNGDVLKFSQTITEGTEYNLDTEHGNTEKMSISGKDIYITSAYEITQAVWLEDGYLLKITYYGTISVEEIVNLIKSVK